MNKAREENGLPFSLMPQHSVEKTVLEKSRVGSSKLLFYFFPFFILSNETKEELLH